MENNLFPKERSARAIISLLIAIFATHYQEWWLIAASLILMFTSMYHYCPTYSFFGINAAQVKRNRYLSELPKFSPVSTFIFNMQGEIDFQNPTSIKTLFFIKHIKDIDNKEHFLNDIKQNINLVRKLSYENKTFLFHLKFVTEINSYLAYGIDVTELTQANKEIIETQKELLYRLGEIGETRSKETGNHVKRVAQYSYILAKLAGIDEDSAELLQTASPMHDIGKIAIPDAVLLKPGSFDKDEWEIMKGHAIIGADLLGKSERPIFKAAAIIAGEHHEKWDGTGYPNGTKGNAIHIYGRITAIVDVFDALGSDRVYKKAWPIDKIINLFKEESGKHFDPDLVSLFLNNLESFTQVRDKYTDG